MTDLIIINADILTVCTTLKKANAVAVKNGLIMEVGDLKNILRLEDKRTEVIDLKGKTLCPGFIDPHLHFREIGRASCRERVS
jgi:predicted amidohydrolase YtcJ